MKMKKALCTLVASLLMLAPEIANAATITATFNNVVNGNSVTTNLGSTTAGYMNWTVNSSSGLPFAAPSSFYGFCIQWGEFTGSNVTFGVTSALQTAPQGSPPGVPMGATAATALNRLFDNHFSPTGLTGTNATAFQLAVWEIVYEGVNNTAGPYSLASGGFSVSSAPAAAVSTATTWLNNLFTDPIQTNYGVYALTSADPNGFQDQVIGIIVNGGGDPNVDVPEPATMSLLMVSSFGAVVYRVRRRKGGRVV
jgi:hypothetical protein